MKARSLEIQGLVVIELEIHRDGRGFFVERFHAGKFEDLGLPTQFVQENHSRSLPGVLRGLHYQHTPPQGKLVSVANGRIWDVVVDLRSGSPTFGKYFAVELNDTDGRLLWIPSGFAHGFCVLGDKPADVVYSVDSLYNPEGESGILWNDPELAIPWPIENPILSKKDQWLSQFSGFSAAPVDVGS